MSWFSVGIFLRSVHEPPQPLDQEIWEECIFLVEADSATHAIEKAELKGKSLETTYETAAGDTTSWRFGHVDKVCAVPFLADGVEIFSRFLKRSEVESLSEGID